MNMNEPQTEKSPFKMKEMLNGLKIETSEIIMAGNNNTMNMNNSKNKIIVSIEEEEEEESEEAAYRSPSADADTPRVWIDGEMESLDANNNNNIQRNLLVLLDWDDTLFPTSMIVEILKNRDKNGFALVCDDDIELLNKLGILTLNLLTHLIEKYGADNVYIVTNSLEGWIKDSLAFASCISKIYKQIETLLYAHNITMDSAQTIHGKKENSTPIIWKRLCFDDILNSNKTKPSYNHIISIGDQWTDHHSVKQSINSLNTYSPIHHMIKLKMTPNLNDMINEILYVQTCFNQIFDIISTENSSYYTNNSTPIIVDYHKEEIKYMNVMAK